MWAETQPSSEPEGATSEGSVRFRTDPSDFGQQNSESRPSFEHPKWQEILLVYKGESFQC